jgi:hypothetical protein
LAAAGALAFSCTSAALLPALGADPSPAIPELMLPSTAGWTGFIVRGTDPSIYLPEDYLQGRASVERAISLGAPPAKVTAYLQGRTFNEWIAPVTGIGPISDGPEHPFYNNNVAQVVGKNPSYRIADLTSEAARNLMPWALEAVKKQNAIVLVGKNGETRQARCWETGVPNIHEAPQSLYFIQTPKEVVMYQGGRVRHVYLNVSPFQESRVFLVRRIGGSLRRRYAGGRHHRLERQDLRGRISHAAYHAASCRGALQGRQWRQGAGRVLHRGRPWNIL